MKVKSFYFLVVFIFIFSDFFFSQIGAEAQGGKVTMWAALGIDQKISEHWTSVTDLGYGRHSDPNNFKFSKRQGLDVLTEDFIYRLNSHWSFNFSLGYWRRNFYSDDLPYDARSAPYQFRNEIRPFQKLTYSHALKKIKISHTLRSDYRFYYDQYFKQAWTTPFEFRARYLEKWKFPLSRKENDWFILIDEILSAIDQNGSNNQAVTGKKWSPYQFTENRLSFYYRRSVFNKKIDLDFGVMHQYWREKTGGN